MILKNKIGFLHIIRSVVSFLVPDSGYKKLGLNQDIESVHIHLCAKKEHATSECEPHRLRSNRDC